ncbi:MAG: ParB/RepB/Spo0J family partition protein [Lentilitoribacter sp.]
MSDEQSKKRLGRGLAALIGEMDNVDNNKPASQSTISPDQQVPIEFVVRNAENPRQNFDHDDLVDLARSIRKHGIVQPIVVRRVNDDRYEIIAGERRWRAAQQAELTEIPVLVRDVDDKTALEIAIVENVQRADLNPLEEALGYEQLMSHYGYTQNDLGEVIGKSRSHVANSLRLLKLPDSVRDMLVDGSLSAGHARALVSTSNPLALAKLIVEKGLSVRDAERLAQEDINGTSEQVEKKESFQKDADTMALEKSLTDVLGLKVQLDHKGEKGKLQISYKSLEQLDSICKLLGVAG